MSTGFLGTRIFMQQFGIKCCVSLSKLCLGEVFILNFKQTHSPSPAYPHVHKEIEFLLNTLSSILIHFYLIQIAFIQNVVHLYD